MTDTLTPLVQAAVAAAIAEEGWTANDTAAIEVYSDGSWIYSRPHVTHVSGRWDRDPDGAHGIYVRVDD